VSPSISRIIFGRGGELRESHEPAYATFILRVPFLGPSPCLGVLVHWSGLRTTAHTLLLPGTPKLPQPKSRFQISTALSIVASPPPSHPPNTPFTQQQQCYLLSLLNKLNLVVQILEKMGNDEDETDSPLIPEPQVNHSHISVFPSQVLVESNTESHPVLHICLCLHESSSLTVTSPPLSQLL
jgi:hypothetical protein